MKVLMIPNLQDLGGATGGIARVVEAYYKYLPKFGVEFVHKDDDSYDVKAVHAGMTGADCTVAHLHGMYFTADYNATPNEYKTNASIVHALRGAKKITVPSDWVAEVFRRDMHINPVVVPHGIDWDEWQHNEQHEGYVLWNKNRIGDVCSATPMGNLAKRFGNVMFASTYQADMALPNVKVIGVQTPQSMKLIVQRAGIYLSTTKETFGIGTLEAMASGVPILGFAFGGNNVLVQHKVNGYLAKPNDYDDLARGLEFCMKNRTQLGKNGRYLAQQWTWEKACEIVYNTYVDSMVEQEPTVSVIIPLYNYADKVERTINSVLEQTHPAKEIIIVDDGSSDNPEKIIAPMQEKHPQIKFIRQANSGVAIARNNGILASTGKYVSCIDSDDAIAPLFLERCVTALEEDRTISIAYTGLELVYGEGKTAHGDWPGQFNFDEQMKRKNQIPTCCVFRREVFDRLGGYRQRYAPNGAGSEDAEFWLRAGAFGMDAKKVTEEYLFLYSLGTGITSQKGYKEQDWVTAWHPYAVDGQHNLASLATPSKQSHPVRQYDEPVISVIIPVGEKHKDTVITAIDSCEAQLYRKWELILVWDGETEQSDYLKNLAPFAKIIKPDKPRSGPGACRNLGAKHARGQFLMFLDADDYLLPDAMLVLLKHWNENEGIIYSDYYGIATIEDGNEVRKLGNRLQQYNEKNSQALVRHKAQEYSCLEAQKQPAKSLYHWCLVTCLIPKQWHNDIGGFDESMITWEDVDYHWRMARQGKCYIRVPDPLMVYNFNTGTRRELALEGDNAKKILDYLADKYRSIKTMACTRCGKRREPAVQQQVVPSNVRTANLSVTDENFVIAIYTHPNVGEHRLFGSVTKIDYGYRSGGEKMLVHKKDVAGAPHLFTIMENVAQVEPVATQEVEKPVEEVVSQEVPDITTKSVASGGIPVTDLDITESTKTILLGNNIRFVSDVVSLGVDGLTKFSGIGIKKATQLYEDAKALIGAK